MRAAAKQQPVSAFPGVLEVLKHILKPYDKNLKTMEDSPTRYTLGGTILLGNQAKESMLIAVYSMKNYVSIHLMPIYMCPESADGISAELKKHKQGKACFNFAATDEKLFRELAGVVKKSLAACKAKKLV
jgi:hypothetical protein